VLLEEYYGGYPLYKWLIVGHLCEAEAECRAASISMAASIREARLLFMAEDSLDAIALLEEANDARD
jgi:hypothetical protein